MNRSISSSTDASGSAHLINRQTVRCCVRQLRTSVETPHLEMDLTTAQWSIVAPILTPAGNRKNRGRPLQDTQAVLNGVLWVLRTGARWADLPPRYPPYQTCHRRFREWLLNGTLFVCFRILAADLQRTADEDQETTPAPQTARSWKWHTAQLLQCQLARQALQPIHTNAGVHPPRHDV